MVGPLSPSLQRATDSLTLEKTASVCVCHGNMSNIAVISPAINGCLMTRGEVYLVAMK